MAETALIYESPEVYAHSLRSLRLLGEVALIGCETNYKDSQVAESWYDFTTALGENLATDAEFNEKLIFSPLRSYEKYDGKVISSDGKPIVDLVSDGLACSRKAAESDSEMRLQAVRDEGDVMVAEIVDELEVGELYAVVSMDPKKSLERNPDYWRNKGYREGMAVLQVYYRSSEGEVIAGAYSIKQSNREVIADIFKSYRVHIPEDESDNKWIRHGIRLRTDREDAEEFGKAFVVKHRSELGISESSLSVTDLIKANDELVKSCFETYVKQLAISLKRGSATESIRELATEIMNNNTESSPSHRRSLIRLANGSSINDDDVRFMEEKIRYALVEELRKLIPRQGIQRNGSTSRQVEYAEKDLLTLHSVEQAVFEQNMSHIMAGNIASGLKAGRSYGGCATAGEEERMREKNYSGADQQNIFGGKGEESSEVPSDDFGPLKFKCPKGHWNERKRELPGEKKPKHFLSNCKVCDTSLMC